MFKLCWFYHFNYIFHSFGYIFSIISSFVCICGSLQREMVKKYKRKRFPPKLFDFIINFLFFFHYLSEIRLPSQLEGSLNNLNTNSKKKKKKMPFQLTSIFKKLKMNKDSSTSSDLKSKNIFKRIRRYYRNKKEEAEAKELFDKEQLELLISLNDEINWIHEDNQREVDQYEIFEENILETSSVIEETQEEEVQEKENFWRQRPKKEPIVKIVSKFMVKQFPRRDYEKLNPYYYDNEAKQSIEDSPKEIKSILKKPKPITLQSFKVKNSITPLSTYSNLSLNPNNNNNSNSLLNTPTSSIQPSPNSNMLSCGKPASSLELSKYLVHSTGTTFKCMSEKEIKKLTKKNTKMNKKKW